MSGKTIVLASLAAALRRPVAIGEPHVIGSWRISDDGRKHWNGVVLWDAEGSVCAVGRALWIELQSKQPVRAFVPFRMGPLRSAAILRALALAAAAPVRAADEDPAGYVDPMIGTFAPGFVFPGAAAPFGMVQNSPDTRGEFAYSGYLWSDPAIQAFSLVHLSGPGVKKGGDVPVMPVLGEPSLDPNRSSRRTTTRPRRPSRATTASSSRSRPPRWS